MSGPPIDLPNLDETIVQLPDDIRQDLATRCASNLFIFAKAVLGFQDITASCHGPLCVYLDHNPARFKLLLMPRGHFKTSVATISGALQRVVLNPEERMLLANETSTNAERFLSSIKQHVESNVVFRTLYSHVIPPDTRRGGWSQGELTFNRKGKYPEPTIDTIGMTGAMTSRHYTHLIFDDPISEEAAKSELVMQDVIGRITKLVSLMVNAEKDTMWLIGTRWAFFDVYSYMMQWLGPKLARFVRAAIEDEKPIFPERFSLETLSDIRSAPDMGEYMFSCLYMNNPRNPSVQDFNINDMKFWRWSADGEKVVLYNRQQEVERVVPLSALDITITVDLAPAEKLTSDRNAVVTCGTTQDGNAIVLDTWAERGSPLKVIEHLIEMARRYHPRVVGIESVGYQRTLKYFLGAECARQNIYLNVQDIPAKGKKEHRIRGLQPVAATGHLYILPTQHILRNEISEFPLGQHDDVLDALAMQLQLWRGLLSTERMERYKRSEDRLLRATQDYGFSRNLGPLVGAITDKTHPRDIPTLDDLGIDPEDYRYGKFVDVEMR